MPPIPASFNLSDELARGNTRENRDRLTRWVGRDPDRLAHLMRLYLQGDRRDAQLAAGVVTLVADDHPDLMGPWLAAMVRRMQEPRVHPAVVRTAMHVLQVVEIPRRLAGRVAQVCFDALEDLSQPIAVRVFAMTVLVNVCLGPKPSKAGGQRPRREAMNDLPAGREKGRDRMQTNAMEPELAREVALAITTVLPYGTGAFVSRARRELRRLERATAVR